MAADRAMTDVAAQRHHVTWPLTHSTAPSHEFAHATAFFEVAEGGAVICTHVVLRTAVPRADLTLGAPVTLRTQSYKQH